MTDHASNFGINQLGGGSGALLGIGSVVFSQQFEGDWSASNGQTSRVEFFNRHLGAVFVVLAEVGNRTTGGSDVTNLDDLGCRCRSRRGCCDRRGFFFFAASGKSDGRSKNGQFQVQLHGFPRKGLKS
ncbi:hypothetical protein FQZ97_802270 [compost metagenome]